MSGIGRNLVTSSIFIFLYVPSIYAQSINCKEGNLKIPNFKADSTVSFSNDYVKANALSNIKESLFPFEFRIYSIGSNNQRIKVVTLQGNAIKMNVKFEELFMAPHSYGPKFIQVYNYNKITGNKLSRSKTVKSDCAIIETLIKNNLFTLQSSRKNEFAADSSKLYFDASEQYIFEIKVQQHYRNFVYKTSYGYKDLIDGRRKKIDNILSAVKQLDE